MKDQLPVQYGCSAPFCLDSAPRINPAARSTVAQLLEVERISKLTSSP
jgi:hypothetical protein